MQPAARPGLHSALCIQVCIYAATPHSYNLTCHSSLLHSHLSHLTPTFSLVTPHSYNLTPQSYNLTPHSYNFKCHSSLLQISLVTPQFFILTPTHRCTRTKHSLRQLNPAHLFACFLCCFGGFLVHLAQLLNLVLTQHVAKSSHGGCSPSREGRWRGQALLLLRRL